MTAIYDWNYRKAKKILEPETLPAVLVDVKILDENVQRLRTIAENAGKTLRVASKSVRVPGLLKRIREGLGPTYGGLMTYSPAETLFLHDQGFTDFLLAYPRARGNHLESLLKLSDRHVDLRVIVDEPAHLTAIDQAANTLAGNIDPLPVCVDLDVSYRPGNLAHLGVRRSPIRTLNDFESFYQKVKDTGSVVFDGVMGYEAQQAGVPDASPYHPVKNYAIRLMKTFSRRAVARKRRRVAAFLEGQGENDYVFNAGGTGSIHSSVREDWVTEVTAGSGFLQSHLFDYYRHNENRPAFCFALRVTRRPEPNVVTCQGGGFIASGPTGRDKAPRPFRPEGLSTVSAEGFGEVQTPLSVPEDVTVEVGDPLLFRPAKAGEIAERFDEYLLIEADTPKSYVKTYRGHGRCFH